MRVATVRAAMRRGCVWPIIPATPRPSSRQILGSCVVLPRAGFAADDDDLMAFDQLGDLAFSLHDRQFIRERGLRQPGAAFIELLRSEPVQIMLPVARTKCSSRLRLLTFLRVIAHYRPLSRFIQGLRIMSVSVGFIGAGNINRYHMKNATAAGLKLVAVADVVESAAADAKKQYAMSNSYSDYKEMLADKDIQGVIIGTPNNLHAEQAIASLARANTCSWKSQWRSISPRRTRSCRLRRRAARPCRWA